MVRIACIGDSNTFGFDPQSLTGGRYAAKIRWADRLAAAGFAVRNLGVNGLGVSRESVHPVLVGELLSPPQPDLAAVMLGSNDLLTGLSAPETARSMKKLLSLILEKNAAATVWLIAPVPFRPGVWVPDSRLIEESKELAVRYRLLADGERIRFADAGEWGIPLAYDGVHFTEEGHRIFAEKLLGLLRGMPDGS